MVLLPTRKSGPSRIPSKDGPIASPVGPACSPAAKRGSAPAGRSVAFLENNRMTPSYDRSRTLSVSTAEEIRAAFPALGRRHGGYPVAYFDGPGGTQVPLRVVEA